MGRLLAAKGRAAAKPLTLAIKIRRRGDRFGRKRPLLAGLVIYIIASVACAEASTMSAIVISRFVQAFGGSVVPTIVQAMVRDLYDRNQSARILSLNMLVTASAPVVAPLIGGQVLLWLDWRAIFWVLVGFGVLALFAALALPETLNEARRNEANPLTMLLGYFELFRNLRYVGYVTCSTLYFCCLLPSSPARRLFTSNISACRRNIRLSVRREHDRHDRCDLHQQPDRGAARRRPAAADRLHHRRRWQRRSPGNGLERIGGVAGIAPPLFVVLALLTIVASNAISGALAAAQNRAGACAALAGALQFGAGALTSAAIGWFADGSPGR